MKNFFNGSTQKNKSSLHKYILPSIAAILISQTAGICMIASAVGYYNKSIMLKDYINTNVSGYDTCGTLNYEIDWDAIEKKVLDDSKKTSHSSEEAVRLSTAVEEIKNSTEITDITKQDNIANGDVITLNIDYDGDMYNSDLGCFILNGKYTFEVNDLKPLKKISPLDEEHCKINVYYPDGYGEAVCQLDSSVFCVSPEIINPENNGQLSNGDKYTFSYKYDDDTYLTLLDYCKSKGYYFDQCGSVTKTVEGLESYVEFEDYTPENLEELKETVTALTKKSCNAGSVDIKGMYFIGANDMHFDCMNFPEAAMDRGIYNALVVVADYKDKADGGKQKTVSYMLKDVKKDENGKPVYPSENPFASWLGVKHEKATDQIDIIGDIFINDYFYFVESLVK